MATFPGDITVRASMREGMSGADWVIHAAADLDLTGPAGRMEQVNVAGSENVASLASKLGVPRFLSVSSVAYFGGSPADGSLATEETARSRAFPDPLLGNQARGGERDPRLRRARAQGGHGLPQPGLRPARQEATAPMRCCARSGAGDFRS